MNRTKRYGKLALPLPSHPFSTLVRRVIEQTKYKKVLAANAALLGVVLNVVTSPSHAFDYAATDRLEVAETEVNVKTENTFAMPVTEPIGVSQGYYAFHAGVDIRAPKGSPVVAAADGVVVEVEYGLVGYGHYVRVAHQGTISTLYAHLDEVRAEVGQKVQRGQEIGTVGTTGWSTGPHLHVEVYEGNRTINPGTILSI